MPSLISQMTCRWVCNTCSNMFVDVGGRALTFRLFFILVKSVNQADSMDVPDSWPYRVLLLPSNQPVVLPPHPAHQPNLKSPWHARCLVHWSCLCHMDMTLCHTHWEHGYQATADICTLSLCRWYWYPVLSYPTSPSATCTVVLPDTPNSIVEQTHLSHHKPSCFLSQL